MKRKSCFFILSCIFLSFMALISACTRTVYIPVTATMVQRDSLAKTIFRIDTIMTHDSVSTFIKGDTVLHTVIRNRYKMQIVRDTLRHTVHDTIYREIIPPQLQDSISSNVSSHKNSLKQRLCTICVILSLTASAIFIISRRLKK